MGLEKEKGAPGYRNALCKNCAALQRRRLFRMNLDVAAPNHGARVGVITLDAFVVVDEGIAIVDIPDLDAEGVAAAAIVDSGQHETVVAGAVDRAHTLVLGLILAGYHQPIVAGAVEVKAGGLKLEFRLASGRRGAALVLGDKAEVGFAGEIFIQPRGQPRCRWPTTRHRHPANRHHW